MCYKYVGQEVTIQSAISAKSEAEASSFHAALPRSGVVLG